MVINIFDKSFVVEDLPNRTPFWEGVKRGSWEPETFHILKRFLRSDRSYLDIGAWIGPTALYGCQLAKTCYAFEPDPVAFDELEHNRNLNPDLKNLLLYKAAIGANESRFIKLGAHDRYGDSMTSLLSNKNEITVDQLSLTAAIEMKEDLNFIKMDIEGGEAIILPSAIGIIQKLHPTLYLSLHGPMFPGGFEAYFNRIMEVIGSYKKIYTAQGIPITFEEIPMLHGFQAIVCTNEL